MREPFFAANWKMHKTPAQTREYARAFVPLADKFRERSAVVLCPPFIDLVPLHEELLIADSDTYIELGAQDVYWEPEGAFTGEISPQMLAGEGVQYCIVGHSERRRLFGETDEMVAKKVFALIAVEIVPIVCIGETLEENRAGTTRERVTAQIHASCRQLTEEQRGNIVIAYEPVWAIGTGMADTPENANETIACIREAAPGLSDTTIIYGGSMNTNNARALCAQPNIDGGLVGSSCVDPVNFATLIENGLQGWDDAKA
jgi:triosephosphate isomerase